MLRRVIDALLCAQYFPHRCGSHGETHRVYKLVYPAIYCCGGAAQSCQFPEGANIPSFVHAPKGRCELSSDAWDKPRRRSPSCGSCARHKTGTCLLGQQYESGAAPDGRHLVAELPDPSTPCRTDAAVRHGAPRRQGLAGSKALGTDATAAAHKQGAAWPSSSRIKSGPSSRRRRTA